MHTQCPFCNKTDKDFYLHTHEFATIYNISPILPGHSLVIPKFHCESLFDLTDAQVAAFMRHGRDTARLLGKVFDTDAFNWAVQEKEASGQSVAHLHMHVVPRKIGDLPDPGSWYQRIEKHDNDLDTYERFRLSAEQLADLTEKMRQEADRFGGSFLS